MNMKIFQVNIFICRISENKNILQKIFYGIIFLMKFLNDANMPLMLKLILNGRLFDPYF